mmetsp:Transcript_42796/g.125699  ORF Transcript_42796/g.125699 Transcript_42796/m.125699 type:complete len:86 (+) Transcript_42796:712-969(+)|eukprot:2559185-Prymnesium_polylepis.1
MSSPASQQSSSGDALARDNDGSSGIALVIRVKRVLERLPLLLVFRVEHVMEGLPLLFVSRLKLVLATMIEMLRSLKEGVPAWTSL